MHAYLSIDFAVGHMQFFTRTCLSRGRTGHRGWQDSAPRAKIIHLDLKLRLHLLLLNAYRNRGLPFYTD